MTSLHLFTEEEIALLIACVRARASVPDIAAILNRSESVTREARQHLIADGRLEKVQAAFWNAVLSARFMLMVSAGKSDDEIAARFGCDPLAVKARRCRVISTKAKPAPEAKKPPELPHISNPREPLCRMVLSEWKTGADGVMTRTVMGV